MSHSRTIERLEHIPGSLAWLKDMVDRGIAGGPVEILVRRPLRSLDQNSKMWPMLADIAQVVKWYDPAMEKMRLLTTHEWKCLIGSVWQNSRMLPGIDGGMVSMAIETSKLSKRDFSELIECIYAFGSEHGVTWSEKAEEVYKDTRLPK